MQNGKLRLTVCTALTVLVAGLSAPAFGQSVTLSQAPAQAPFRAVESAVTATAPDVFGRAAYLLDAATGEERFSKQADVRMPIASLTKVMTAHIVLAEADLTDTVEIIRADVQYARSGGGTTADLRVGDRLSVEELLYALMLPSGADAAHALARTYGPGVAEFTDKMNAKAAELGLKDTLYVNADGLPTPNGHGHSTARDQARLAELALRDPAFSTISSTRRHSVPRTADHRSYTWTNTNRLLGAPGVLGVKTGFTRAAGFCLAFASESDGRRYVGVILGETASARRFQTAGALLDWVAGQNSV